MRELERCRRTFCDAVSKAQGQLVVSYFSKADLELAERTHMLVRRVRAGQDGRIALVTPSTFIGDARSACPGACGGQAKLAEIGVIEFDVRLSVLFRQRAARSPHNVPDVRRPDSSPVGTGPTTFDALEAHDCLCGVWCAWKSFGG